MAGLSFLLPLVVIYFAKDIDWTDGDNSRNVKILFYVTHVLVLAIYYYIKTKIIQQNDQTLVKDTTTVRMHDEALVGKQITSTIISVALMTFLNYQFQAYVPLLLQSLMNPFTLYQHKLFRFYILNERSEDLLTRPWVEKIFGMDPESLTKNNEEVPPVEDNKSTNETSETKEEDSKKDQ